MDKSATKLLKKIIVSRTKKKYSGPAVSRKLEETMTFLGNVNAAKGVIISDYVKT